MLIVSISNPPQVTIGYDGHTYTGPVFDVPQNVGELLMGRADLWRLPTQEEIDGADVDHLYDGRNENQGRPERLHDGRTRRRGAEALAEVPKPDYDQQVAGDPVSLPAGSTEPTDLTPFEPSKADDDSGKPEDKPADEPKPAAKKTAAKKTAAPKPAAKD